MLTLLLIDIYIDAKSPRRQGEMKSVEKPKMKCFVLFLWIDTSMKSRIENLTKIVAQSWQRSLLQATLPNSLETTIKQCYLVIPIRS